MRPPASPTHGQPSRKTSTDGERLPGSSSRLSVVPPIPQEHDARRSCEARSRSSPGSDGLDRSGGTASASSSRPEAPDASSPLPSSAAMQGMGVATSAPCETEAASPKHVIGTPRRRSEGPRRSSQRLVKSVGGYAKQNPDATSDCDSDDETSASTGSHDKTRSDDESYPPSTGRGDGGQGAGGRVDEADDESDSPPPKRRKHSRSPASTRRKRGRGALSAGADAVNSLPRAGTSRSACGVPSPPSSHCSSQSSPPSITSAKFEEWSLPNATLKRITLGDGRTTFQLQFDWDPHVDSRQAGCPSSNGRGAPAPRKGCRRKRDAASSDVFTKEEDELLIRLKEGSERLTWPTIHRQFSEGFPERRSQASLQVHYSTKLKRRKGS